MNHKRTDIKIINMNRLSLKEIIIKYNNLNLKEMINYKNHLIKKKAINNKYNKPLIIIQNQKGKHTFRIQVDK